MKLKLRTKPFSFHLRKALRTAQRTIKKKQGWLINIEDENGKLGWGEVSSFSASELLLCETILNDLGNSPSREVLEQGINQWPGSLGFGFGSALGEIDCLIGNHSMDNWLRPSSSALLLPTNASLLLKTLDCNIKSQQKLNTKLTFKWKVAIDSNEVELKLLKAILLRLPRDIKLRLDANGGWNRNQAEQWVSRLKNDPRLEWLEQPLPANDIEGLSQLAQQIPIALDESLVYKPSLRKTWQSWQIRRPSIEGDPRKLLKELNKKNSLIVISTAFETGIGGRWVEHLAALQEDSTTSTQPGLAPGWCPDNQLFSYNPEKVWEAA